jgi:hypothetical protein
MRFAVKAVLSLALLGALGLVGFAIFADLPAPSREISLPVEAR